MNPARAASVAEAVLSQRGKRLPAFISWCRAALERAELRGDAPERCAAWRSLIAQCCSVYAILAVQRTDNYDPRNCADEQRARATWSSPDDAAAGGVHARSGSPLAVALRRALHISTQARPQKALDAP